MIYAFIGPPACGKSTQAELLQQVTGMRFISMGRLLREQAAHNPAYAENLAKGELFPASVIQEILNQLHRESPDNLIIDGALRRDQQVDKLVELWGQENIVVVLFDAQDDVLMARSSTRHDDNRTDDSEKTTAHRIALYRESLPSILDRIQKHNLPVVTIDATPSVDAIHHDVVTKLNHYELPTKN